MVKRRGFTLIELMVVVAIIVLLVALLLPSLARAKEEAKLVKCGANLHAIGIALATYESQNKDMLPSVSSNVPQTGNGSGVWLPDWYGAAGPTQLMGWADQMYVDGAFTGHSDWKGKGGYLGDGSAPDNNYSWHYPTWGYGMMQCPKHDASLQWDTSGNPSDGRSNQGYSLAWCARSSWYDGPQPVWTMLSRTLNQSHIVVAEGPAQMAGYSSYFVPAHMKNSSVSPGNWVYGMFERHKRNNTYGANYLFADSHVEYSTEYGWAPSPFSPTSNYAFTTGNYKGPATLPNGQPNQMRTSRVWAHGVSDQ